MMGKFREVEKRFSSAHVGSFTMCVEEVMDGVFQRRRPCVDNSSGWTEAPMWHHEEGSPSISQDIAHDCDGVAYSSGSRFGLK